MSYPQITEPEQIPERFVSGWNHRDVDELVSIFVDDAEFVNVVGLWWHNKQQIRKAHDYGLKKIFSESEIKLQKTTVKFLTEEVAVVHAKMRLENQTGHSREKSPELRHNLFSFVVQKFEDGWKCVSAHNTDIAPGAETNVHAADGSLKPVNYRSQEED
jgi:uncharacterized protein (TIGR02246 family)